MDNLLIAASPLTKFLILTGCAFLLWLYYGVDWSSRCRIPAGKIPVPVVGGALPYIGHGFSLLRNPISFLKKCGDKYGPAFVIKVFRTRMMIICDHPTAVHHYKGSDDSFSFKGAFRELVGDCVYDCIPNKSEVGSNLLRRSVRLQSGPILELIQSEVNDLLARYTALCDSTPSQDYLAKDLMKDVTRTLTRVNYAYLVGEELSEWEWDLVQKLYWLTKVASTTSVFLPRTLIKWTVGKKARILRDALMVPIEQQIQSHRADPHKSSSHLIRLALDSPQDTPTNEEIAKWIIKFIMVGAESSLAPILIGFRELVKKENAGYLKCLREECKMATAAGAGPAELLQGPVLNAFTMESVRHIEGILFSNFRKPLRGDLCLGDYFIGPDIDIINLSLPMILIHGGDAGQRFKNPKEFQPTRFEGVDKESFAPKNLVSWGNGVHACPGKTLSIYQTKLVLAYFVLKFDLKKDADLRPAPVLSLEPSLSLVLKKRAESEGSNF